MVYEWDERKARRIFLIKIAGVLVATAVTTVFQFGWFSQRSQMSLRRKFQSTPATSASAVNELVGREVSGSD